MQRLLSTVAFGALVAALVVLIGARDVESYDHAFFSLDRGTAADSVRVLGLPVYTLSVGFGARLPLHGSLGASPAAAVARFLPAPLTYWLMLTLAIAAAALLVRDGLEPLCGRAIAWTALVLLFLSVPMANYAVFDDWPETVLTYCAFVGGVFAPLALLSVWRSRHRPALALLIAGLLFGLVAGAHPGYWPLLAPALVLSAGLALGQSEHSLRARVMTVGLVGCVSLLAVAPQLPDIARELAAAESAAPGRMTRLLQGPTGTLLAANAFPFVEQRNPRLPFTFLLLALVGLAAGCVARDVRLRRLAVGAAAISIALGAAATMLPPMPSAYAPSVTWALRDPAAAFAVLSGACAAAAARQSSGLRALSRTPVLAALIVAGVQGPQYAASLVALEAGQDDRRWRWNQDLTPPAERLEQRGVPPDRVPPGERLALWPTVRVAMREQRHAAADFPDAGYPLVTAWTKQRTMRGLIEPNDVLFNQVVELAPEVLCDGRAVRFLRLRYLLLPRGTPCAPWSPVPDVLVDGWLEMAAANDRDDRVWAVSAGTLTGLRHREPALSAGSGLFEALVPLPNTSTTIQPTALSVRLDDPSVARERALVFPVAYDTGWRATSGQVQSVGGLLGLVGVDERQVTLAFVPDLVAILRALSLTLAQALTVLGLLGRSVLPEAHG